VVKNKIFFLIHAMDVGGVEKALLGLLSIIPFDQFEIHLGVLHKKGGFLGFIPQQVIIHEISCYDKYWDLINDPPLWSIKRFLRHGNFVDAFIHFLLYIHFKLTSNRYWFYRYIMRDESIFPISFDVAVAFAGPSQMMDYYICNNVKAKIKCGWIHFDISKFGIDKGMTRQLYKKYKRIFIVSETAKAIFDQTFPQFKDKTEVFHNVVSPQKVREMALIGETYKDDFAVKRILTVGRISSEKGQLVAIQALKTLKDKGYYIRWYFIGEGSDMEYCKNEVDRLGLSKDASFLGTKTNPYAYMRDCDVYMQPSRHEGFCITLAEALCFGNPIVATDFTGAREQLQERENGFVVGMNAVDIAEGVEKALAASKISNLCDVEDTDIDKFLSLVQI